MHGEGWGLQRNPALYASGRVRITKKSSILCMGKGGDSVGKGGDDQGSRYPSCLSLLGEEWVWR